MTNKNCHEVGDEPCTLVTVECDRCGFWLGIDASFLHNHSVKTLCLSCGLEIEIEEIE
jgi:hypothetical protein